MVLTPIEGAEPEDTEYLRMITILAALLIGLLPHPMARVLGGCVHGQPRQCFLAPT